jgi:hypothetical protein
MPMISAEIEASLDTDRTSWCWSEGSDREDKPLKDEKLDSMNRQVKARQANCYNCVPICALNGR